MCVHHNCRICLSLQGGGLVKAEIFKSPADAAAYSFRPVLPVGDDDPQKKLSEMSHSCCPMRECVWIPNGFIILAHPFEGLKMV